MLNSRKRGIYFISIILFLYNSLFAQNVSITGVDELIEDALMQYQEKNYQEALDKFLKVGEITHNQQTDGGRKIYVLSQTMAVGCYQSMKKYDKGYQLCEELIMGNINDDEREKLHNMFVFNGYCLALKYMHKSECRYTEAIEILEKIKTYADEEMLKKILPRIPMSWYMKGAILLQAQKYSIDNLSSVWIKLVKVSTT